MERSERWNRPEQSGIKILYPIIYSIHLLIREKMRISYPEEKIKKLHMLYPGSSKAELQEWYDYKKISLLMGAVAIMILLVGGSVLGQRGQGILKKSGIIERSEPGGGNQYTEIKVRSGKEEKNISLTIPERVYAPEELEAKFAEARQYIRQKYLGENKTSEEITQPLCLIKRIPGSCIKIQWSLDTNGYINKDGTLNNSSLKEKTEVVLAAVLKYGQRREVEKFEFLLCPKKKNSREKFWEKWQEKLDAEMMQTAEKGKMVLPQKVEDAKIQYQEVTHPVWKKMLLFGLALCVIFPMLLDYQTEQGIRKRDLQLQKEYPEMVERFVLLLGAGLTIRGTWERITRDYEQRKERGDITFRYLYEEMLLTRFDLENGKSEVAAYTSFGRRVSLIQYMKFSTLLVQNLKKGSDDLLRRMNLEAEDAARSRQELAKKMGEEAGTRLLLPMMIMLVVVFALIMVAAFHSM